MPEPSLPVDSLKDAAPLLRRPFTAEAVKWKVQTGTLVVPYVDARLVIERLNLVIPHKWHDEYEAIGGGQGLLCRLTVDGVTRLDVGEKYTGKGLYSDAFKRAAVKFGVGVSLYALPKVFLSVDKKQLKKTDKATVLTDKGESDLRKGYEKWLTEAGQKFGEPLDHGDAVGAIGDVEAEAESSSPQPELPEQPEPLTDAKALALTAAAQKLFDALTKEQAKGMPPAAFKRALAGAAHSHEALEDLITKLEKRANA